VGADVSGIFSSVGGRRFTLALLTLASINVLLWFAKMTDVVYRDVLIATVAVYVAGNVIQKVKARTQDEADA
jgi:hypothetical protein